MLYAVYHRSYGLHEDYQPASWTTNRVGFFSTREVAEEVASSLDEMASEEESGEFLNTYEVEEFDPMVHETSEHFFDLVKKHKMEKYFID